MLITDKEVTVLVDNIDTTKSDKAIKSSIKKALLSLEFSKNLAAKIPSYITPFCITDRATNRVQRYYRNLNVTFNPRSYASRLNMEITSVIDDSWK